jgi:hypothetical protein
MTYALTEEDTEEAQREIETLVIPLPCLRVLCASAVSEK